MLAGLFLSKYSEAALGYLGFSSYSEAFNVLGFALKGKPASIKNYMQEFDPMFPNHRKGWKNRAPRKHCVEIFEDFSDRTLSELGEFLRSMIERSPDDFPPDLAEFSRVPEDLFSNESFAKRITTGIAAEAFFEQAFPTITEFGGCSLKNVTTFGCGFDFQILRPEPKRFFAVEVKGIYGFSGEITLTEKEHRAASLLEESYFLCVVQGFSDRPKMSIYRNPLQSDLVFTIMESLVKVVQWRGRIS